MLRDSGVGHKTVEGIEEGSDTESEICSGSEEDVEESSHLGSEDEEATESDADSSIQEEKMEGKSATYVA